MAADMNEITELLIAAGAGATAATGLLEGIKKLRGNKTEIYKQLREMVEEVSQKNNDLMRTAMDKDELIHEQAALIADLQRRLAECCP